MLSEKIPALFVVLCIMTLHWKEVISTTYYMDDSENDCSTSTKTVYSYSHTVKAWKDSLRKPSLPSRTCTLYFDTLYSSTYVKVSFLSGSYFNCGTTLTFYDGSTTYSNKLRTITCGGYSTSAIYSTSRYLTVKLTTTSSSTAYDFTFYVSEIDSGSSTVTYVNVGGIIGGLVGTIGTVIFCICICRCICKRKERQTTTVVYRERETSSTPSVNVTLNTSTPITNINSPQIAPQMINQGIGYPPQPQPAYLPQPPVAYPPPPQPQPGGYPQQPPHNPQMAPAAPSAPPPYPGGHPAQYPKY